MDDSVLFAVITGALIVYVAVLAAQAGCWIRKQIVKIRTRRDDVWFPNEPMECPACKEIALVATGIVRPRDQRHFVEYECEECRHYETS